MNVGDDLLVETVACSDDEDRHLTVNQGDRPMFHFRCRIALGMDVRYFFQFQGSFQSQGVVVSTAQVEAVLGVGEDRGQVFNLLVGLQSLLHLFRKLCQFLDHLPVQVF